MEPTTPATVPTPSSYWNPRRRVYAAWAVIVFIGFTLTHYNQTPNINVIWLGLTAAGLGYMYMLMPLRVPKLRHIFLVWLGVLALGMAVSLAAFRLPALAVVIPYLGAYWLMLMGLGHWLNGLVDAPAAQYWISGSVQVAVAAALVLVHGLLGWQYLAAAIVGAGAMVWLIIKRGV